jgi:hypothetical protein
VLGLFQLGLEDLDLAGLVADDHAREIVDEDVRLSGHRPSPISAPSLSAPGNNAGLTHGRLYTTLLNNSPSEKYKVAPEIDCNHAGDGIFKIKIEQIASLSDPHKPEGEF